MPTRRPIWDLFCRVIDNHGDLGVAVRLARQLAQHGQSVRLWVDEPSALAWMAPDLAAQLPTDLAAQQPADLRVQLPVEALERDCATPPRPINAIRVLPWQNASAPQLLQTLPAAAVWVELFGCELPQAFVAHGVAQANAKAHGHGQRPVWLNLEYLSAEAYVARSHGLPSHIGTGPAKSWTKWFFYPGFTPDTGGLLRAADAGAPHALPTPPHAPRRVRTTLFCYEPPGLQPWLAAMQDPSALPLDWLVMPGRPARAFAQALGLPGEPVPSNAFAPIAGTAHQWRFLPHMTQPAFDASLAAADLNFVRGEDSLVSGLRAGQPLIWHIYPQDDNAHHAKLHAFLDWLHAPPSLIAMHLSWNGMRHEAPPVLTAPVLAQWQACFAAARERLASQADLVPQLIAFARAKSARAATPRVGAET